MPGCPICKRVAATRAENAAFPFCSSRCKLVDLGKWMSEEYRVPTSETPEEDSSSSNPTPQEQQ